MSDKTYQLQTLSRALDVLTLLETSPEALTMTAIAERLGEANPVIFRVLKTLETKGFIRRVDDTKKYAPCEAHDRLGMARLVVAVMHDLSGRQPQSAEQVAGRLKAETPSVDLALNVLREGRLAVISGGGEWSLSPLLPEIVRSQSISELVDAARPVMDRLYESTEETLVLFLRNGISHVALHVLASRQPLRYDVEVGSIYPLQIGAAGKASLAWLDEAEMRRLLTQAAQAGQQIDLAQIAETLREVRAQGFAHSYGERIAGAAGVALPLIEANGDIRCVISITGPATRLTAPVMKKFGCLLRSELIAAGLFCDPHDPAHAEKRQAAESEAAK